MKSIQEIESLKQNWRLDPIWDIETTEGFEDHKDELLKYRLEMESAWNKARYERRLREAEIMGVVGNEKLYKYLKALEYRIDQLEDELETFKYNSNTVQHFQP